LKISEDDLKDIRYDALKIAEKEFRSGVLPIAINRPTPQKGKERLSTVKEDKLSDEELIAKAKEVEKEIVQDAKEMGFVNEAEADEESSDDSEGGEEK